MGALALPLAVGAGGTALVAGVTSQVRAADEAASQTRKAQRQQTADIRRAEKEAEDDRLQQRDIFAAGVARRQARARAAARSTRSDVLTGALGVVDGVQGQRKILLGA